MHCLECVTLMPCLQRGCIDGSRLAWHANMVVAVRAAVRLHESGEKVEALLAGVQLRQPIYGGHRLAGLPCARGQSYTYTPQYNHAR